MADVGEDETRGNAAEESGREELALRKTAETCEAGDSLAQDWQTPGDGDTGAACLRKPFDSRGEAFLTGQADCKPSAEMAGELVGKVGGEEQPGRGNEAAGKRSVEPSQRGHNDGAWDREEQVCDEKGDADEPCETEV